MKAFFISIIILVFASSTAYCIQITPPYKGILAVKAVDLTSGKTIVDINADTPLIPASSQKLITLYSAINLLDIEDEINTSVYYEGRVSKGVLKGDLYIKFRGAPDLDFEKLTYLLNDSLNSANINTVNGNIYIDDTEFDEEYFGPGWPIDQVKFCGTAPISSAILNENCFEVEVRKNIHGNMMLDTGLSRKLISVENNAYISNADKFCDLELKAYNNNTYNIYGCYQAYNMPPKLRMAVQNPRLLVEEFIREYFSSNKIDFKEIKYDYLPARVKEIGVYKSDKIKDYLIKMTKDSHNMIAELMFKKISAQSTGYPGSWKNSSKIVTDFFNSHLNISKDELKIMDGSGLSRKNLISPNVFVEILKNAYNDKKIFSYFYNSLAVAGDDGTLNYRFQSSNLKCKIFAKTGTLDNVSSLTGYAFLDNGKKIAFSIIYNNFITSNHNIKKYEEKLLEQILASVG